MGKTLFERTREARSMNLIKPDTYIVISDHNPSPSGPLNYHVVSSRYDFEGTDRSSGLRGHGHWKEACSLHTRDESEANERARILNEFAESQGFHWRAGRYFKRMSDGSVAIINWSADYYDPATGFRTPDIEAVIPAAEWASIVSYVSGETNERYEEIDDEGLAKLFHETYERLAPSFNYQTRKASAVHWADVPPNNKALMVAVCRHVLRSIGKAG